MFLRALLYFSQARPINDPDCPVDGNESCNINLPAVTADRATIEPVLQIFFGILALIAVIVIIVSGIKFVTSQGEPQKIKDARNTLIWAILGLVIALSAELAVYLLIGRL